MTKAVHPEIHDLLEEAAGEEAPGDTVVILRCRSSYIGKVVNGRWFVYRCRGSFCTAKRRKHAWHVIDITTGAHRTVEKEPFPAHREE